MRPTQITQPRTGRRSVAAHAAGPLFQSDGDPVRRLSTRNVPCHGAHRLPTLWARHALADMAILALGPRRVADGLTRLVDATLVASKLPASSAALVGHFLGVGVRARVVHELRRAPNSSRSCGAARRRRAAGRALRPPRRHQTSHCSSRWSTCGGTGPRPAPRSAPGSGSRRARR